MESQDRSFTVEASTIGDVGGRYINRIPRRAAMKAARVLFDKTKQSKLRLQLRETTRGSSDRLFAYEATQKKVNKTVKIAGKNINITQEISLAKVPLFHGDGARKRNQSRSQRDKPKKRRGGYFDEDGKSYDSYGDGSDSDSYGSQSGGGDEDSYSFSDS